jgi:hypothetical protein
VQIRARRRWAYDLVLTDVCEDPIGIKILTDREKTKDVTDQGGNVVRSITTGTLKVQLLDLRTLETQVLNVSGPQVAIALSWSRTG